MEGHIKEAINEFSNILKTKLKDNIKEIRLFGSVARGNASPDSDIDILVILRREDSLVEDIILDTTVDVNLKYDVVVSATTMTERDYTYAPFMKSLFYKNIQKEGVLL
ncbi:MAG: nucleotidyltransferase domain-containing protein [Bacillota bacterium]